MDILTERERSKREAQEALNRISEKIREEYARAHRNKPLEDSLWDKFKQITDGVEYFKLKHIDALDIPYNILLFLSNKNTGKTTEIYRNMSKWIDEGTNFIYMRASKGELDNSAAHFMADSISPCIIIKNKATYFIYAKKDLKTIEQAERDSDPVNFIGLIPSVRLFNKYHISPVGMAIDFKNCQSIAGGQFENYKYIIMDECLTYSPNNVINEHHFSNWAAFPSSIARNKPDLKIYMFGNLRDKNIGLLDFYGIGVSDRLRYIERGEKDNLCRILFINSGDIYKGNFKSQKGAVQHVSIEHSEILENNLKLLSSSSIIERETFEDMPEYAHVAINLKDDWLITVKKWEGYKSSLYAIKVVLLRPYYQFNKPILSNSHIIANRFENVTYRQNLSDVYRILFTLYERDKLHYADQNSLDVFSLIYDKYSFDIIHKNRANALSSIGIKI